MSKENLWSVMDLPKFEPWTTENWFDSKGILHSQDIFLTQIRLKQGTTGIFSKNLLQKAQSPEPYFLEFYSPAGSLMKAEVRGFSVPLEQNTKFDTVNLLVSLSQDQILILFPNNFGTEEFGY